MATIFDYINWRSDLSFHTMPENELDHYILSVVNTVDYSGIVPEDGEIRLEDAVGTYLREKGYGKLGVLISKGVLPMLDRIYHTERYKDVMLSGYESCFHKEETEQFAALTVRTPHYTYITYRATDDTIAGWKENFTFALYEEVAAQRDALAYLEKMAGKTEGPLIVSGHSKGGNIAVYSAVKADETVRNRIRNVFDFDGPGFRPEFLEEAGYRGMRDKICKFVPDNSMVGQLLYDDCEQTVVKSTVKGASSHDGLTWAAGRDGFLRAESLTKTSLAFNDAIDSMFTTMSLEEKKEFIEELFGTLTSNGAVTLTDLVDLGTTGIIRLALSLMGKKNRKVHSFVIETLKYMAAAYLQEPEQQ